MLLDFNRFFISVDFLGTSCLELSISRLLLPQLWPFVVSEKCFCHLFVFPKGCLDKISQICRELKVTWCGQDCKSGWSRSWVVCPWYIVKMDFDLWYPYPFKNCLELNEYIRDERLHSVTKDQNSNCLCSLSCNYGIYMYMYIYSNIIIILYIIMQFWV